MFNSELKEKNIKRLESCINSYNTVIERTKSESIFLLDKRKLSLNTIALVENYINKIANTPKEFKKTFDEVKVEIDKFSVLVGIKEEAENANMVSGGVAGAGVLAGISIAAFMPSTAMAIATTFGTASTGTAIASLSGAAATKAALAWIGGGALAAGGGGIAAGNAFLALSGPIGWSIGAVSLLGSGWYASTKNKEIAEKAAKESENILRKIKEFKLINDRIKYLNESTEKLSNKIEELLRALKKLGKYDYIQFTEDEQYSLGVLVNATKAFAELLNKTVKE